MEVIKYLKSFSSLDEGLTSLTEEFGIKVKKYDDLFCLKYSQIDSPKTHPIVKECRGLILSNELEILCRPFDRFFNYGEGFTENFDFENSVCMEKVDGSLIKVWYNPYSKSWECGTSGTAFAEAECSSGKIFKDLFEETLGNSVDRLMGNLLTDTTFLFELCTRENRVVKKYDKNQIIFIGARNNINGMFYSYETMKIYVNDIFENMNIRLPKIYSINELDKAREKVAKLENLDEGFVFWNMQNDERVKMKSPAYVAVHHLRDNGNINPKRISELVFINETGEYLSYFPEDKKYFESYLHSYENFIKDIHNQFKTFKNIKEQKEYALKVKDHICSGILFGMRNGKDFAECCSKLSSNKKIEILEFYKEK